MCEKYGTPVIEFVVQHFPSYTYTNKITNWKAREIEFTIAAQHKKGGNRKNKTNVKMTDF